MKFQMLFVGLLFGEDENYYFLFVFKNTRRGSHHFGIGCHAFGSIRCQAMA